MTAFLPATQHLLDSPPPPWERRADPPVQARASKLKFLVLGGGIHRKGKIRSCCLQVVLKFFCTYGRAKEHASGGVSEQETSLEG